MLKISTRAAVLAVAMAMPAALYAQRGMGGMGMRGMQGAGGRVGGNPVAPLIDMRRELDLTARQLTQLDEIERSLLERNRVIREQLRTRLDSMRPRTRESGEAEIQRLRAEGDSLRALRQVIVRNDSVARVAAMAVLNDSQRVQVRERLAERRGFQAGRMSTMRGGQRGLRGRQGMPGGGPGLRRGDGGRMGMMGPGMRQRGGMRGPDSLAPRGFGRRPGMPDDAAAMRRFRGMPADSLGPDGQFGPRRRQLNDSTRLERAPRLRRPPVDGR